MDISIYGVLECLAISAEKVQLNNISHHLAKNVSNVLLILYVISYMTNRKAIFLVAFLLPEFLSSLVFLDVLSDVEYYLFFAVLYNIYYVVAFYEFKSHKICFGYVMLLLLLITMTYNEIIRSESGTIVYIYYEWIFMAIHLYIISAITEIRKLLDIPAIFISLIRNKLRYSYDLSFFWYTIKNHQT